MSPNHFDVVVIGAGIVGAACAYRLAERGLAVCCVEREPAPASGSTACSAAGVRIQFSDATNIALSAASIDEYAAMPAASYQACGYLFLVPAQSWPAHLEGVTLQRQMGHDVQVLSPDESQAIVASRTEGIGGATFHARDGFVDPHGICLEYVARARALGAAIVLRSEVIAVAAIGASTGRPIVSPSVLSSGSCTSGSAGKFVVDSMDPPISRSGAGAPRWRLRCADGRELTTRWIVNACGAWSGRTGALAGLNVPVSPARRMVFSSGPQAIRRTYPLTIDVASGAWFRSEGQRLIFGRSDPEDVGFSEGMNWPWLEATIEPLLHRFPWFEQITLDRRASWWGYYEVTPDHQPLVGPTRQAPGWLNACGFSGHGVQQAAAIGRIIAQLVSGETPFIDIGSLDPDRFRDPSDGHGHGRGQERLIV